MNRADVFHQKYTDLCSVLSVGFCEPFNTCLHVESRQGGIRVMDQKEEVVGKFRRRKWLGGWWGWDGREWVKREDNWKGGWGGLRRYGEKWVR